MRKLKRAEEKKKSEDRKKEIDDKKKFQELNEKAKAVGRSGGGYHGPYVSSYDLYGRAVDVLPIIKFPVLVPECGRQSKMPKEEPAAEQPVKGKQKNAKKMSMAGTDEKSVLDELYSRANSKEKTEDPKTLPLAVPMIGVYESFVPTVGVTFQEKGKEPKANTQKVSETSGKLNKTEFYSLLAANSMKPTASLPSLFLPEIGKAKLDSSESSGNVANANSNSNTRRNEATLVAESKTNLTMSESPGDISQLLVADPHNYPQKETAPSMLPKLYVPPTFRRNHNRNMSLENPARTMKLDAQSITNMEGGSTTSRRERLEPIALGGRGSPKFVRESLGIL